MFSKITLLVWILILFGACSTVVETKTPIALSDYVNTLVGSESEHALSNGNTYPAIALPWGMNFWTP